MIKKDNLEASLLIGIFSSSILIWVFLYTTIVELTTQQPASLSLLYLGFSHYLSFLCVMFSFVLLVDKGLQIGLEEYEYNKLKKFQTISKYSRRALFSLWGPMLIFSICALLTRNFFVNSKYEYLEENGGFILGFMLCIVCLILLRIKLFILVRSMQPSLILTLAFVVVPYLMTMSLYASDVQYKSDKYFYRNSDVAHIEVKRKGYILLPQIKSVVYNFSDTLPEQSFEVYFIELNKYRDTRQSILEITYTPQVFGMDLKKYVYINRTPI